MKKISFLDKEITNPYSAARKKPNNALFLAYP